MLEEPEDIDDQVQRLAHRPAKNREATGTTGRLRATGVAVLLAVVVVAAVVVIVRYPSRARDAAKVNGVAISQKALDQQLSDIAANAKYVQLINQGGSGPVAGTRPGTYDKAFVAAVLNEDISSEVIGQQLHAAKATPSPAEVAAARTEAAQQYPSGIFSAFGVRYQAVLATEQAWSNAFVELETAGLSPAALDRYYQAHLNDYATEACVRHILIADEDANGQIDYPTSLADAGKIKAQLAAGGDFAGTFDRTVNPATGRFTGMVPPAGSAAAATTTSTTAATPSPGGVAPISRPAP